MKKLTRRNFIKSAGLMIASPTIVRNAQDAFMIEPIRFNFDRLEQKTEYKWSSEHLGYTEEGFEL